MNENWITIAPVGYGTKNITKINFQFDNNFILGPMPEWFINDKWKTNLNANEKDRLKRSQIGFQIKYKASSLGDPDPSFKGEEKRSLQDKAEELVGFALLSIWITKPSLLCCRLYTHWEHTNGTWIWREINRNRGFLIHPKDVKQNITEEDLVKAKNLYSGIIKCPRKNNLWTAIRTVFCALSSYPWSTQYLLFWIAIEALFGDSSEITYRISQRLALFMENDKQIAYELFKKIKNSYTHRSSIAHGSSVPGKTREERERIGFDLQEILCKSLIMILEDQEKIRIFSSKDRKEFLDKLCFGIN